MKNLRLLFALIILVVGCKKDYSYEGGVIPTVDSLATYSCTGTTINGIYKLSTPLVVSDSITETVNVVTVGKYDIRTDTLNGIYFKTAGSFTTKGTQTVTLTGKGMPLTSGNFIYKPSIGTGCSFTISVAPAAVVNASYTLVGWPNSCTGFILHGVYAVGYPADFYRDDTVVVAVNV